MRSFDNVTNPYRNGLFQPRKVETAQKEASFTTLAPNPDYKGRLNLPTRMDGHERAIVSGQVRIVSAPKMA